MQSEVTGYQNIRVRRQRGRKTSHSRQASRKPKKNSVHPGHVRTEQRRPSILTISLFRKFNKGPIKVTRYFRWWKERVKIGCIKQPVAKRRAPPHRKTLTMKRVLKPHKRCFRRHQQLHRSSNGQNQRTCKIFVSVCLSFSWNSSQFL